MPCARVPLNRCDSSGCRGLLWDAKYAGVLARSHFGSLNGKLGSKEIRRASPTPQATPRASIHRIATRRARVGVFFIAVKKMSGGSHRCIRNTRAWRLASRGHRLVLSDARRARSTSSHSCAPMRPPAGRRPHRPPADAIPPAVLSARLAPPPICAG